MNWEEIILQARVNPIYKDILYQSYLDEDLILNIERFRTSEEFINTLSIIDEIYNDKSLGILDIGCGNGISAISFALKGHEVTAVEPDPSGTVGRGAIKKLCQHFHVSLNISDSFGERLPFEEEKFDLVYLRQTLHHAKDLNTFLKECYRVLKSGGIIFSVRDHVVFNKKDKEWFLNSHPFHKFYGGENAFTIHQYKNAFENAGFNLKKILKHYDSVLNYSPMTIDEFKNYPLNTRIQLQEKLKNKLGIIGNSKLFLFLFRCYKGLYPSWYNEKLIPGRLYSFVAVK